MARQPREKSGTGIYHVMVRGVNRQKVFHDDEDRIRLLEVMERYRDQVGMKVFAWCLMGNHAHWVVEEVNEELAITMKRIGVSYAWFYRGKYQYVGHLFQDRYRSEGIEQDEYLLTVVRYVHQNPVKAGFVRRSQDWRWSSLGAYLGQPEYPVGLTDRELVLGLFAPERDTAIRRFREYHEQENEDKCLEENEVKQLPDLQARVEIQKVLGGYHLCQVKTLPKKERDEFIKRILEVEGMGQRQVARILGISPNVIFKA